jgi:hypothetical protein
MLTSNEENCLQFIFFTWANQYGNIYVIFLEQEQAVDPKTRLALYKMVNAGLLNAINGVVSCGKESVVFHAYGGRSVFSWL